MTNKMYTLALGAAVLTSSVAVGQVTSQSTPANANQSTPNANPGTSGLANGSGNQTAAPTNAGTFTPEEGGRIVQEIQHKLLSLDDYDVFDSLSFGIRGKTIILQGYASRPQLKSAAERAIKSIRGIESVEDKITVLPYSPNDDRIRIGAYQSIYGSPSLRKYTSAPVGFGRQPSIALAAGGITNDPPLGFHAIHIVVNNGHIMLTGVVDSKSDAEVAAIQANSTPGAFSVSNQLQVAGKPNPEK